MVFEGLCHVLTLGFWVHEVDALADFHVSVADGPGVYVADFEVVDVGVTLVCLGSCLEVWG